MTEFNIFYNIFTFLTPIFINFNPDFASFWELGESTFAYIGPGMGGGLIAAIFGIIAAFFLGLWGILYYPIKRAIKNNKLKKKKLSKKGNQRTK